ncbi:carbon-nitrogen hydrolase [Balneola vulgaris]|uniref:carbon-nitrogen hydrolase n=1 Tax=Balneola vulgaris TaxID=287535 RepID=UPI00036D69BC|nr:carbon-nitrogen hydrolase [Balneola vulgaris]
MENKQRLVKLGLIQTYCEDQPSNNIERVLALVKEASSQGAQVICLQELFNTPYFCREYDEAHFNLAQSLDSQFLDQFASLAKELNVVLVIPFFEKRAQGVYHNSAVVIDVDGERKAVYRKLHIPDDPGFYEKYYFTPGDEESGFQVVDTAYGKIGVLICWDQWFPEAARITALKGAEIIFYPTAIGMLKGESRKQKKEFSDAWQIIQRSHAIANGCYVAAVNRVGKEKQLKFWGKSFVAGPFGQIIEEAGEKEEILIAECDLSRIEAQRREWPFLRDRRIDLYDGITKRILD